MNTEQERALLPCPFCGGEPSITKQMGESLWSHDIVLWTQVQCDGCEAHVGPTCEGFEVEAVDIWNRRAALQSPPNTGELPRQSREAVLRAMSRNYTPGKHTWDSLDSDACAKGADEIRQLRAALALQSQDAEDAERYRYLIDKLQRGYDGEYFETDFVSIYCHMRSQFKGDRVLRAEITWRDKTDEPIGLSAAIDHARSVEGGGE